MRHRKPQTTTLLVLGVLALALIPDLAAGPAAATPTKKAKLPHSFVGMLATNVNAYSGASGYVSQQLARISRTGAGTIRTGLDPHYSLKRADAFVLDAARHKLAIMPLILDSTHFHAGPGPRHGYPAPNPGRIARFAAKVAHRYGPKGTLWKGRNRKLRKYAIHFWQIWNEPNLPVYWRPGPNPRGYVRLVKVVAKAIHRYDKRANIVSAGLPDSTQSHPYTYSGYLAAFLRAGGWRYIDSIGVHIYKPTVGGFGGALGTYRRIANAHHGRRLPLWITEFGWADAGYPNPMVVGRAGQAARITGALRTIGRLRKRDRIVGAMYFEWRDYPPRKGDPRGDTWGYHTGLFTASMTAKAAYHAFVAGVRRLR